MDEAYEKIIDYIKCNYRKMIFPAIVVFVYIVGFIYLFYKINNVDSSDNKNNSITDKIATYDDSTQEKIITDIYIDVKGAVTSPGVYKLNNDSRVIDAINAAGGINDDANTRFINLSKKVVDGDVIVVYSNKEIEEASKENIIYVETPCICEEIENNACYVEEEYYSENNISINTSNKININTASVEELTTLSGIGEAKAKAIIEYREENGLFKAIEDLVNVSGISETLFSKIKENITV